LVPMERDCFYSDCHYHGDNQRVLKYWIVLDCTTWQNATLIAQNATLIILHHHDRLHFRSVISPSGAGGAVRSMSPPRGLGGCPQCYLPLGGWGGCPQYVSPSGAGGLSLGGRGAIFPRFW